MPDPLASFPPRRLATNAFAPLAVKIIGFVRGGGRVVKLDEANIRRGEKRGFT